MSSRRAAQNVVAKWLTAPLTPKSLRRLRQSLSSTPVDPCEPHKAKGNAGVLIPFCNVNNEPSILFELRAQGLRNHSGEISFPGGRVDDTDPSFVYTALRETREELGIAPSRVQVLGHFGPPELNKRGDLRVWPTVGFVHASEASRRVGEDEPFPSLDMDAIRKNGSPDEVATAFHLPLSSFVAPARLRQSLFRGEIPYWVLDVDDFVAPFITDEPPCDPARGPRDKGEGGGREAIELWGLTGWYMNILMQRLGLYK